MKVTKTSIHRLTIEKTCGCQATREYEDARYSRTLGEAVFAPCPKHNKGAIAEFAGEMLVEALDKEAEQAGKAPQAALREETPTALSGTTGGSVTSMGAPNIPKTRDRRDPLAPRTASFDRPNLNRPQNTSPTGNLNLAGHEDLSDEEMQEAGITMNGSIDDVPEDARTSAAMQQDLEQIEGLLDEDDVREGGVSQRLINHQAKD